MGSPDPIVPRDEAEREARYCRHAWADGESRGRQEEVLVGFALGLCIGMLAAAVAVASLT